MTQEAQPRAEQHRPAKPRPMTHDERVAAYGAPATLVDGKLKPSAIWEVKHLTKVTVPWPGGTSRGIKCHMLVAPKLVELFEAWEQGGLLRLLLTFDGCHNTRMKRGHEGSTKLSDLSTHSFGAAIDVNAHYLPLGAAAKPAGVTGSVVELVPIASRQGWAWGGDFSTRDEMHFELGVI